MSRTLTITCLLAVICVSASCSLKPPDSFPREQQVDLDRYMGAWYVIAHIPPGKTENAYNAIERYSHTDSNTVETVYTYRDKSFDNAQQTIRPTATVVPGTNDAIWGMQFIWPIKLQYVISYVDDDYQKTIVARAKRDYVWIMARKPIIDDATYKALVERVDDLGYDTNKLRRVPQQPLSQRHDLEAPAPD